jgi:DNA mismatch repair ATPase MutL
MIIFNTDKNKENQQVFTIMSPSPSKQKQFKMNNDHKEHQFEKPKAPIFVMHKTTTPEKIKLRSPMKSLSPKVMLQKANNPLIKDIREMFHTNIGATTSANLSSTATTIDENTNSSIHSSFAERIDLHMCNRVATPPLTRTREPQILVSNSLLDDTSSSSIQSTSGNVYDNLKALGLTNNTVLDETLLSVGSQAAPITQPIVQTQDLPTSTLVEKINSRKEKVIKFDFNSMRKKHQKMIEKKLDEKRQIEEEEDEKEAEMIKNLKFRTKNIDSKEAETELDRCITQEDFLGMKVCGQFNKGFIIARLDQDLFIIDQHAADEIYNFEQLQKNGKVDKQKLLQPRYLEITASAEAILIDNMPAVEKYGYEMQVCMNRKVGNRIMISSVPVAKQTSKMLNLKDIEELLFVLSENELNPGSISMSSSEQSHLTDIKSSSLRAIYASKACRKSVMIGDSLNMNEMKRIITHLYEIEKPWNCPHGRPTMRHLINLDLLRKSKSSQ